MDTKKLRQKILDLAIHGKLVPQDPNDEPASVLLERIRAEKERLIAEGKIKRSKKSATSDTSHYENVPFDVPEGWCWRTLGDIGTWQAGGTPSRIHKEYYGGNIPWLKTGDLKDGIITSIPEYITEEGLNNSSAKLNPTGSILIAMYGATIGRIGILGMPATTNQACCACINYKGVIQKYLFYFLLSHKEEFKALGGGGAQPNISKDIIVKTLIPIPPIKEQERIVSQIDNLLNLLETLDTNKYSLETSISQAKSKILDLAIHGKLVPQDPNDEPAIEILKRINPKFVPCDNAHYENVPEGWCTIYVGDLAEYTNGKAFKPSDWERNGLPIIRIQNLNDENCQYNYTSITHEEKYRISHGDLLFAWAASLGVYIWQGNKAWLNQHIFKVDPHPFIDKQYLYYIFEYLVSEFYTRSHGSGMVHITKKEFETTIALLPPLSEQRRIVKSIKSYYTTLDNISANL